MPVSLDHLDTVHYDVETPGEEGIAVVTLDRPATRNAQNKRMTYELNACFDDAARRSDVKVIVLRADGPHFCSGHDLRDEEGFAEFQLVSDGVLSAATDHVRPFRPDRTGSPPASL